MKLIWKLVLPLPALAAALYAVSSQLPAQMQATHSVVVGLSPEQVYPYLNNPMQWPKWSALNKAADPTIIYLFGGPVTGTGARLQWSSDKLGNGSLKLTTTSPTAVAYVQRESSLADSVFGEFILVQDSAGTSITWRQTSALGTSPVAKLTGVYKQYKKQQEVEQGLLGLQTLLTQHSKSSALK